MTQAPATTAAPTVIHLSDYTVPDFLIDTVQLAFDIRAAETRVKAQLAVRRNGTHTRPLVLQGHGLKTHFVGMNGTAAPFTATTDSLTLENVPDTFTLDTDVAILPQENTSLEGLYASGGAFCTQCEAEGFRKITWFLDRPDVMARYTVTIEADKKSYPVLLSNGNPIHHADLPEGRHSVTWEDPFPKPCYLFALVAGDLGVVEDHYQTSSKRQVLLQIYCEHGRENECGYAMESLKKAMKWDEDTYGLEYDLDRFMIVAVSFFNMGAMENKGLNIFNAKYVLARPEIATDRDFYNVESIVAHEYFHNWTGDRVTCRDWFQLSLKEGLTVYRDQEFSADMNSRAVARIEDVRALRERQFLEDSSATAHPVRPESYMAIDNFYTATVYEKGAEVVRMYETLAGKDGFRKGMDLYFQRHDGHAVTCDDFRAAMADANGLDLDQFALWYSQSGTPRLTIRGAYDAGAQTYTLTIRQSCPATPGQPTKKPFHIPVAIGLLDHKGHDMIGTKILELRQDEQSFTLTGILSPPTPSLLRGFSAPVNVDFAYSDEDLAFLMAHDSDAFGRWEAGQTLAGRILSAAIARVEDGDTPPPLPAAFTAAFGRVLEDALIDPAFTATAIALPSESYLGQSRTEIDVRAIHTVREHVRLQLATAHQDQFLALYDQLAAEDPADLSNQAMARRALKNSCLAYLALLKDPAITVRILNQLENGGSMTNSIAALSILADSDSPDRAPALARFYDRWQTEANVIDKWFSVQAMSKRADAIADVEALLQHPAFDIKNPNRVYALVRGFADGNAVHFHDLSGKGYALLADTAKKIDAFNPIVAGRLLEPFTRWQKYSPAHQMLMKRVLEDIAALPGLSKNSREVVNKALS
jgi:aminopeptidase N